MSSPPPLDRKRIETFCRKWKIAEFSLFGSVLRDDFRPDSDVDVLVSFHPDADWSLWEEIAMEQELEAILGRSVDVVERAVLEKSPNHFRREAILKSAQPFYVAR